MSENFMDKTKRFFGFDSVETYNTEYYSDGYGSRERDRADRADRVERDAHEPSYRSRSERDFGDRAERGGRYGRSDFADRADRGDREDRYSSRGGSHYSSYAEAPEEEKDPSAFVSFTLSSYTQAGELVDNLKAREVVVFSLSGMEKGEAKRVLDFAAGLSRGLDAQLKKLKGVRNFILLPRGVTLAQDQLDAIAETI